MNKISKYFTKKYAPRWLILQIDISISVFSLFLAYLLRFNFNLAQLDFFDLATALAFYMVTRTIAFSVFRTYSGIIRHTSTEDALRVFFSITFANTMILLCNGISFFWKDYFIVPISVFLIEFIASLLIMNSYRIAVKILYSNYGRPVKKRKNVVIYGAGQSGLITKRTIDQDGDVSLKVIAFLDEDPNKLGKSLEGVTIYSVEDGLDYLLTKNSIYQLIISIQDLSASKKKRIIEKCLKYGIQVKSIPPANKWINGELSLNQIKRVKIEDLLERDPIQLDKKRIAEEIHNKVVMVTGAGGSIGSELVRQLVNFEPANIILLDIAETPLYDLQLELEDRYNYKNFICAVADVRNSGRLWQIFSEYTPDIVYHVAAYKHVPLMEKHPEEAVNTNVKGTKIMADLSVEFGVEKFVMISTDKAVNPTNVMGASKRIAEIYIQSLDIQLTKLHSRGHTRFITTRFGNVLGSNGSVIPRFRKQIAEGGPITVTHPGISRFFMTIPEACQLILEAGAMGEGGEIFIFDMGKSIKIYDLAEKMIRLSGFIPKKDIKIEFTGLRPGEKIKEELLANKESTLPTHHEKIMIARVRHHDYEEVSKEIVRLINMSEESDARDVVRKMKDIVLEYKSQNSIYEALDKPVILEQ